MAAEAAVMPPAGWVIVDEVFFLRERAIILLNYRVSAAQIRVNLLVVYQNRRRQARASQVINLVAVGKVGG